MLWLGELFIISVIYGLTQFLYWVVIYIPDSQPSIKAAFVKCLPLGFLAGWALTRYGSNLSKRIGRGFLFSVIGDALMVYSNQDLFFMAGMLAFGLAQAHYISAFGWKYTSPASLLFVLSYGAGIIFLVIPLIHDRTIQICMILYGVLLLMTAWRAMARVSGIFSLLTALGALLFVASDTMIAVDKFAISVPYSQVLIMTTYYIGQYLIGLSLFGDTPRQRKSKAF